MSELLTKIRRNWLHIEEIAARLDALTVLKSRTEYGSGRAGGASDNVFKYAAKREQLLFNLVNVLDEYAGECLTAERCFRKMDPRNAMILRGYYCAGMSAEEIGTRLRLDPSRVKHIKADALAEFTGLLFVSK